MVEDHPDIGVQERKTIPPFVGLGVLNKGGGELCPVAAVEEKDPGLGDVAPGVARVEAGGYRVVRRSKGPLKKPAAVETAPGHMRKLCLLSTIQN
jgi:hypothetical protein